MTTIKNVTLANGSIQIQYEDPTNIDSYPVYWNSSLQMIVPIKFQNDDALNYVLVDTGSGALAVHIDNQIDTVTNYNEHACNSTQQCGSINCCNGSTCLSSETCQ
jgi:hypothetical protein